LEKCIIALVLLLELSRYKLQKEKGDDKTTKQAKASSLRNTTFNNKRDIIQHKLSVLKRTHAISKQPYTQPYHRNETTDAIDEIIQGSISTFSNTEKFNFRSGNQSISTNFYMNNEGMQPKKDQYKYFTSKAAKCATFTNSIQQNKVNPTEQNNSVEYNGAHSKSTEIHGGLFAMSCIPSENRHLNNVILKIREDYSRQCLILNERKIANSSPNSILHQKHKFATQTNQITPKLSNDGAMISNEHITSADGVLQKSSSNSCYKSIYDKSTYEDFNKLLEHHPLNDSCPHVVTCDKKLKLSKINEIFDTFVPAMQTTNISQDFVIKLMRLHKNKNNDTRDISSSESENFLVEFLPTSEYESRTNVNIKNQKLTKKDFIKHLNALAKAFQRFAESNKKFQDLCENDKMELLDRNSLMFVMVSYF